MEVRHFINKVCSRELHEHMWIKLHSAGSGRFMDRLLAYFETNDDPGFPQLDRDRMRAVYSFRDGVYAAKAGEDPVDVREAADLLFALARINLEVRLIGCPCRVLEEVVAHCGGEKLKASR